METIDTPNKSYTPMSVKDWVITILITAIPLVGFIMIFVWAFSDGTNESKANWAKASLIIFAVFIVLYLLIFMIFGAAFFASAIQQGS